MDVVALLPRLHFTPGSVAVYLPRHHVLFTGDADAGAELRAAAKHHRQP
jgi:hypothetical protein